MKKISLVVFALVFIGAVSQADQKNEAKKVAESQNQVSFVSLVKPQTEPLMTPGAGDGICPIIGYKVFQGGVVVKQYPPTSADPDCPPH